MAFPLETFRNACYVTVSRTECLTVTPEDAKTMYLALMWTGV